MSGNDNVNQENSVLILNEITKLTEAIEKKVVHSNIKVKECEEVKLLKEKCCNSNPMISLTAFHGLKHLVDRKVLVRSQTISMLVSLLPSVNRFGALVSTIGRILLDDLETQVSETGRYEYSFSAPSQHPFVILLKYDWDKSWLELYHFVHELFELNKNVNVNQKIEFVRPLYRHVFWSSPSLKRNSELQRNLFNLVNHGDEREMAEFALEALQWKDLDVHYCFFLLDFCINVQKKEKKETTMIGLSPLLSQTCKWLIVNGYDPRLSLKVLKEWVEAEGTSNNVVLFLLSDVVMETPSLYINQLVDVCVTIIYNTQCSLYVAHKFLSLILNWFLCFSSLANPLYKTIENVLDFVQKTRGSGEWKDGTGTLKDNAIYKAYGGWRGEVKFAVDFLYRFENNGHFVRKWLTTLTESNDDRIHLEVHTFVLGVLLSETDPTLVHLCLNFLCNLVEKQKNISFAILCLLFYKLGRETDPELQKTYLCSLPKLSVRKGNIPIIVGILESLKRGRERVMKPLLIQLYLSLWKSDNRTYSYLHKMLHESDTGGCLLEHNVSKALALREICRLSPHLHAKDLVGVLSNILNECSGISSGLPSAIAIEAVTELCKAYVIDVSGTWKAVEPRLRSDGRPRVVSSLCRFFGEIPKLNFPEEKREELMREVVPMLWMYTFSGDVEVGRKAVRALSGYPLESFPLKWMPEVYREKVKVPRDVEKGMKSPDDVLELPYVPGECWIQFLTKLDSALLQDGGDLVSVLLERELSSLPRGVFYLPQDKPEPPTYSYLPWTSLTRSLVDFLRKNSDSPRSPEIRRILSKEYSKPLPPLNWEFLETRPRDFLELLAKQGPVSPSCRKILESYVSSTDWNEDRMDDISRVYAVLHLLSKSLSYDTLQSFLSRTLRLSLRTSSSHFEGVLRCLREVLRKESVHPGHKSLVARQLERMMSWIPPESALMKSYAECASEFPVKSVEGMTQVREVGEVDGEWMRRAVAVREAIAMRPDIKNPLVWLNEFTETVAHFPNEQNFILKTICSIIRRRTDCDHKTWLQELTWRIQESITTATHSDKVTFFLVDVFAVAIIAFSGFDAIFPRSDDDDDDFLENHDAILEMFPGSFAFLFSRHDWSDALPKVTLWLGKLSKWRRLPKDRARAFLRALLVLRQIKPSISVDESALYIL